MSSPVDAIYNRFLQQGSCKTSPTNDYHPATKKYVDEALLYKEETIFMVLKKDFINFKRNYYKLGKGNFAAPVLY